MSGDTFGQRLDELERIVGKRDLTGKVIVDQVYAQYQHEGLDLRHPEGGQAKYLEEPLHKRANRYGSRLAGGVLDGQLEARMIDNMEDLSAQVFEHAPVEFGDLKASGHPVVTSDGHTVYDRPPAIHRLTEAELRAKGQVRNLGFGNR